MTPRATLVSIPASNYVEKARWALQLAKIPFVESMHAPLMHRIATVPKGGTSVPLLYLPEGNTSLTDSSDILDYCAKACPSLYPNAEAKELELYYDTRLGPHTRRMAYFFLFHDETLTKKLICDPVSRSAERVMTRSMFPLVKWALVSSMVINEAGAYRSIAKLDAIIAETDEKLGSEPIGTNFLAGDTFSAADIAFCAHMSLILGPPEHVYLSPIFDLVGDHPLRARVKKIQDSKAAQFVYWCYQNKRPAMVPTANGERARL